MRRRQEWPGHIDIWFKPNNGHWNLEVTIRNPGWHFLWDLKSENKRRCLSFSSSKVIEITP